MHPLRVLLIVSLGIAIVIASAFGALLHRAGVSDVETIVLAVLVFVAFLIPWGGVFFWAVRRAGDLDTLIDRTRIAVEGDANRKIADREFHGELDELARAIDALRDLLVEQRTSFAEHRTAIDQIVDSLGEGLLAVSPSGKVVFANSSVRRMFGGAGHAGASVLEVVRKRTVAEAIDKALEGSPSVNRITSASDADERTIEIRVFPVRASSEIAAVALFIDVTEIERLQQIRSDFLDDFSHEVRTPLAGLRTAAETLDAGRLSPEHEQELRGVMSRQLRRIERLVQDLSELNRIESGELVLERRKVDVLDLLADLCREFRERLSQEKVTFQVRGDQAFASGDPERLQQVFSNLLDNAWKYGAEDGEVLAEVAAESGTIVVRISDEGEGIPPGEEERIFHRFYRVDRSRAQTTPGVGLGLAITKHLVLLHGGAIRAYNRTGGGATFEVRLPAA